MKLLVALAAVTALCNAIPMIPGDNSHYVEGESRYIWMPDGEGVPQLVDLHAPVDEDFLKERNGANNQYFLFTRQNPTTHQVIVHGNPNSLFSSNFNPNRPTKIIAHGWNGNGNYPSLVAPFLDTQDCNVISVDWRGAASGIYSTSVRAVPSVGQYAGNFIQWIFNTVGGNWNNVHFVGFSLGAHVVGNVGRAVNGAVARVTGLDPAGPLWDNNSNALNRNAAQYVEAIHTDSGRLGITIPVADADFYPNGGRTPQPGCWTSSCSHGRAVEFFGATIRYNHLVGRLCTSLSQAHNVQCSGSPLNMGNGILTKRGAGLYGLITGSSYPF